MAAAPVYARVVAPGAPGVGPFSYSVSERAEGAQSQRARDTQERRLQRCPPNVTMGTTLYHVSKNMPTPEEE
jgi:hypothetical protein